MRVAPLLLAEFGYDSRAIVERPAQKFHNRCLVAAPKRRPKARSLQPCANWYLVIAMCDISQPKVNDSGCGRNPYWSAASL